ncbi:MAG: hypothetical protein ABI865_10775, partial [Nitrosospira sp.]
RMRKADLPRQEGWVLILFSVSYCHPLFYCLKTSLFIDAAPNALYEARYQVVWIATRLVRAQRNVITQQTGTENNLFRWA